MKFKDIRRDTITILVMMLMLAAVILVSSIDADRKMTLMKVQNDTISVLIGKLDEAYGRIDRLEKTMGGVVQRFEYIDGIYEWIQKVSWDQTLRRNK